MLEKEFTPYKQALELKELGFDEPCFGVFYPKQYDFEPELKITHSDFFNEKAFTEKGIIKSPTYSQAFRWFRDKYDLRIWIESNRGVLFYEYTIATTNPSFIDEQFIDNKWFNTYEKAEHACLKKLIKIVKNKIK